MDTPSLPNHTCMHTYRHTHTHTQRHTHTHARMHAHTHTHTHTQENTQPLEDCMRPTTHTHTHASMHARTHTHTHTHTPHPVGHLYVIFTSQCIIQYFPPEMQTFSPLLLSLWPS